MEVREIRCGRLRGNKGREGKQGSVVRGNRDCGRNEVGSGGNYLK